MMVRYLSNDENIGFNLHDPKKEDAQYSEFSCGFETFGLSDNIRGRALGVDAIDALVNAMMRLDIFLKSSAELRDGKIRWAGGSAPDDFGLPWENVKQANGEL